MAGTESINFDRIADRYDATRGGLGRGVQLAADLAPLLDPAEPVFEVGVGTGVISLALRDHGFSTIGVDISEQMLARARERLGARLVQGDAMQLPVASASLGQMLSVWVLHLVGDVRTVMDEILRCLRPGGRYLVMDGRPGPEINGAVDEIWRELERALGRESFSGRIRGFADHAAAAGLHVGDIVETGPYEVFQSAAQIADNIEGRTNSWMWDIPDDLWNRAARGAIECLRALPDATKPTARHDYQEILVLQR